MTDLKSAYRSLRATPLVSLVAILSLALGIGANTAIFSIVDALILRSLPVAYAERLVVVREGKQRGSWTNPIWESIRSRPQLFDGAFAAGRMRFNAASGGKVDPVDGLFASGDYFNVLGVSPAIGRMFSVADDVRGGGKDGPVAVISYPFWQMRYGAQADVIGKTLTLDRVNYTIIGVAPKSFFGHDVGRSVDVIVPLGTEPLVRGAESALDQRSYWWMNIFARLKPGQTAEQATAALRLVQPAIRLETIPPHYRPQDAERYLSGPLSMIPASGGTSGLRTQYERPLFALTAVVAFTLLIACGNIANLMLARTTARRHEFAVRTALGASRWRLARQLFGENLLLSGVGAALGVLFALWGSRLIVAQIATTTNRVFLDVGIDWRMLGFTSLIAVVTTLLFGIAPTLLASRVPPMEAMKEQGRGNSAGRRMGLAGTLVLAQVSLSLLLLVAAGLFMRTFVSLAQVELGFVPERALVVTVGSQRTGLDSAARMSLYERVRDAVVAVPGVSDAAFSAITPSTGMVWNNNFEFPGRPELPEEQRIINLNYITPGWFKTMGTRIVAGRDFDARDRIGGTRVGLVNRKFAEKYFDGENPIGKIVKQPATSREPAQNIEIIGEVADAVYTELREPLSPTMYQPMAQLDEGPPSGAYLTVRSPNAQSATLAQSITSAVTGVNSDLTVSFRTLDDVVDAALSQERLIAMLSGFFGVLALLLAALGLYGVTSYSVIRRRAELGIRMALGATPGRVVRLVLTRVGALVLGGIALGALASWYASRFVSTLLFGLTPTDPITIASAVLLLALVGAISGWLPARRAAGIDPMEVLREG